MVRTGTKSPRPGRFVLLPKNLMTGAPKARIVFVRPGAQSRRVGFFLSLATEAPLSRGFFTARALMKSARTRHGHGTGRGLSSAPGWSAGANDQLTNAVACAWFELHPNLRYIKYKVAEPDQVQAWRHVSFSRGATVLKETDVEAELANCRALIDQINVGLSAEEPFVNASSAAELLLYLELCCFGSEEGRSP
jgi:hypothetical protein